jgi:uncharacterized protein (TIGR03067 family)
MDLTITEGENANYLNKTALAIYDVDGDTLKWCANEPGREGRPTAFPAKEGEDKTHLYIIFKRAK